MKERHMPALPFHSCTDRGWQELHIEWAAKRPQNNHIWWQMLLLLRHLCPHVIGVAVVKEPWKERGIFSGNSRRQLAEKSSKLQEVPVVSNLPLISGGWNMNAYFPHLLLWNKEQDRLLNSQWENKILANEFVLPALSHQFCSTLEK